MWYLLVLLVFGFSIKANGQKNYSSLTEEHMQAQHKVNDFDGAVLVAQKGKILYEKAFGDADREWKIANTTTARFAVGSLTKQFTATAILQMAEQNKLSLEDRLSQYFPGFPRGDSISLHMLLNHSSGIADYTQAPAYLRIKTIPVSSDTMITLIKNLPLSFPPGKGWAYSNSNYYLLACIIERISRISYQTYLQKNVFTKAGLTSTDVNRWDTIIFQRSKGYIKNNGVWKNAEYISVDGLLGAGSLYSSLEDLSLWDRALFSGKIISQSSLARMTTPNSNNYGYGLFIDTLQSQLRYWHNGNIPGFTSYNAYYPGPDLTVCVLSNNGAASSGIGDALSAILLDVTVMVPYKHLEKAIDSGILKQYTGTYLRAVEKYGHHLYPERQTLYAYCGFWRRL